MGEEPNALLQATLALGAGELSQQVCQSAEVDVSTCLDRLDAERRGEMLSYGLPRYFELLWGVGAPLITSIAAWWFDGGECLEVEIDDGLQGFGGGCVAEAVGQGVDPGGVVGLQRQQFGDGVAPALRPGASIGRAAVAACRSALLSECSPLGLWAFGSAWSPLRNALQLAMAARHQAQGRARGGAPKRGRILAVVAACIADFGWDAEPLCNDLPAFSDADRGAVGVAQFVVFAGTQHFADAVDQTRRYGTEGLLVMVPFANHQAPVDHCQSGVDAPCGVGGEIERPLDSIAAGLGDGLSGLVGAAGGIDAWEHPAEAAELVQPGKPLRLVQHAEHEGSQGCADAEDAAKGVGRMKLCIQQLDLAAELDELCFEQAQAIDFEGDLQLHEPEVDCGSMKALRFGRSSSEPVNQGLGERPRMGMIAAGVLGDEPEQASAPGLGDHGGVEQVVQDGERQVGAQVRENGFNGGAGPADQVEQPTFN